MAKKKALGHDPLSWIKDTRKESPEGEEKPEKDRTPGYEGDPSGVPEDRFRSSKLPKFITFRPCTMRVSVGQLDFLAALEREIMRNRTHKKERITKNSIIRVAIEIMRELNIDTREIPDEGALLERARQKFRTS